ncbi:MAG: hypothetical protein ACT4O3_02845 [Elusimicrobiota bacterium]
MFFNPFDALCFWLVVRGLSRCRFCNRARPGPDACPCGRATTPRPPARRRETPEAHPRLADAARLLARKVQTCLW